MHSTRHFYVRKIDLLGSSLKIIFRSSLLEVERFLISISNPAQRFSVTVKLAGRGGILIFFVGGELDLRETTSLPNVKNILGHG